MAVSHGQYEIVKIICENERTRHVPVRRANSEPKPERIWPMDDFKKGSDTASVHSAHSVHSTHSVHAVMTVPRVKRKNKKESKKHMKRNCKIS